MKFNETRNETYACIYKIDFPNGKSYIGQTKNLADRVRLYKSCMYGSLEKKSSAISALLEFGEENVDINPLVKVDISDKHDLLLSLSILEIKYIREHNTIQPNGYNISIGGEVFGIPTDYINTDNTCKGKHILVYDLDGNFINEYDSIAKTAYFFGVDEDNVRNNIGKRNELFMNTYMLKEKRYGIVPEKILPFKPKYVERTKIVENRIVKENIVFKERTYSLNGKTVWMYKSNGEYCQTFESKIAAGYFVGAKSISLNKMYGDYFFIKANVGEDAPMNVDVSDYIQYARKSKIEGVENHSCSDNLNIEKGKWSRLINDFKIAQYDFDGVLVKIYDNIRDASYETGIRYSSIYSCIKGKSKTSNGYIWLKME